MKFRTILTIYILFVFFIPNSIAFINTPGIPLLSVCRFYVILMIITILILLLVEGKKVIKVAATYPFFKPMLIVILSMLVVTFFAERFWDSLNFMFSFIFESFFLSLIIWIAYQKPNDIVFVLRRLIVVFVILSVYGTVSYIIGINPIMDYVNLYFSSESKTLFFDYADTERLGVIGRSQSIFSHPIQYGAFLVMLMCMSFYLFISETSMNKYFQLLYIIIFVAGIIFTYSRTPIFMFFVIISVYWYFQSINSKFLILFALLVFGSILIFLSDSTTLLLLSSIIKEISVDESAIGGSSITMRIQQLFATYILFTESPIVGHGLAATRFMSENNILLSDIRKAESVIFSQLIDAGLLGLSAYIYFYYYILKYFLHLKMRLLSGHIKKLTILTISLIAGYLVFIIATGVINTFQLFIILITLIARYIQLQSTTNNLRKGIFCSIWKKRCDL